MSALGLGVFFVLSFTLGISWHLVVRCTHGAQQAGSPTALITG